MRKALLTAMMVAGVLTSGCSADAIQNAKKGDIITFGSYEQDANTANGREPVEWEVLYVSDDNVLVVSRYVLDCVPYNTKMKNVTWENCTLRAWLNNGFYNAAFSAEEQERIMESHVINRDNAFDGTQGGSDTRDKVFCLSVDEVYRHYDFNAIHDEDGLRSSEALITEATPHASGHHVFTCEITNEVYEEMLKPDDYSEACIGRTVASWWLRTSGSASEPEIHYGSDCACIVANFGETGWDEGAYVVLDFIGVRPALRLKR